MQTSATMAAEHSAEPKRFATHVRSRWVVHNVHIKNGPKFGSVLKNILTKKCICLDRNFREKKVQANFGTLRGERGKHQNNQFSIFIILVRERRVSFLCENCRLMQAKKIQNEETFHQTPQPVRRPLCGFT